MVAPPALASPFVLLPPELAAAVGAAGNVDALVPLAREGQRRFRQLAGRAFEVQPLVAEITRFNDLCTERALRLHADAAGLDLGSVCWLVFGSAGRREQTLVTDQDNGLVLANATSGPERERWLACGAAVNRTLDACGQQLCKGGVMAGNPGCCLTLGEWQQAFDRWIEHGSPTDLLHASIHFDLRPLAGNAALAQPLCALVVQRAAHTPRFCKQLADNALDRGVPLNWRGALAPTAVDGRAQIDLKLQGTAIFVDGARLYALAAGVHAESTPARLAALPGLPASEREAWTAAFDALQALRLRVQALRDDPSAPPFVVAGRPNAIDPAGLGRSERRQLTDALRAAQQLQHRIALDYRR